MAILSILFGSVIGFSLGLLGGGGSVLAVPALVYGLGQPLSTAIPTSLLVVGLSSLGGAVSHLRAHRVFVRTALTFGGAGLGGSFLGAWANHHLPDTLILVGYSVLMASVARGMFRRAGQAQGGGPGELPADEWRGRALQIALAGFAVGFVTSLFGIGGGFIIAPALILVMRIPVHIAVGTALFILVMNALSGFVAHLGYGHVDWGVAALFSSAGIWGAVLGSHLAPRIRSAQLMRTMAAAILILAAYVLVRTLVSGSGA